jgi:hypothetical protein
MPKPTSIGTGSNEMAYEFNRLDIEFVDPGREKIEEAVRAASQVDAYIKSSEFSSPVYMITGVMIARGAAVAETKSNELGTHMRAGFDGTSAGALVTDSRNHSHRMPLNTIL